MESVSNISSNTQREKNMINPSLSNLLQFFNLVDNNSSQEKVYYAFFKCFGTVETFKSTVNTLFYLSQIISIFSTFPTLSIEDGEISKHDIINSPAFLALLDNNTSLQLKINTLTSKLQNKDNFLNQTTSLLQTKRKEVEELKQTIKSQAKQIEEAKNGLRRVLNESNEKIHFLEDRINDLQLDNKILDQKNGNQNQNFIKEIENLRGENEKKLNKIRILETTNQQTILAYTSEMQTIKDENERLKHELQELQKSIKDQPEFSSHEIQIPGPQDNDQAKEKEVKEFQNILTHKIEEINILSLKIITASSLFDMLSSVLNGNQLLLQQTMSIFGKSELSKAKIDEIISSVSNEANKIYQESTVKQQLYDESFHQYIELKDNIEKNQNILINLNQKQKEIDTKLKEYEGRNDELLKNTKELSQNFDEKQKKLIQQENNITKLEEQSSKLMSEILEQKIKIQKYDDDIKVLQEKIQVSNKEKVDVTQKCFDCEQNIQQLSKQIENLKLTIEDNGKTCKEREQFLNDLQIKYKQDQENLQQINDKISQQNSEIKEIQVQGKEIEKTSANLNKQLMQREANLETVKKNISTAQCKNDELQSLIQEISFSIQEQISN